MTIKTNDHNDPIRREYKTALVEDQLILINLNKKKTCIDLQ